MLYSKSRLIFGPLKNAVKNILNAIYKVLKFFNLQLALLVGLIGVVLYFSGVFENSVALELVFYIVLIFSIIYAVIISVGKVLGLEWSKGKKENKRSKVEIVEVEDKKEETEQEIQQEIKEEKIKYFKVRQKPGYYMAEFEDRFELYYKTVNGLQKVRTDYKEK
ncbi:MAG: hypothetical protein IJW43_01785 [Clostridia bacterium]|nr:hypothetical protein [Clostridia bacterium]